MTEPALDAQMVEALEQERELLRTRQLWSTEVHPVVDEDWGCLGDHREPPVLDGCARPLHRSPEEFCAVSEEELFDRAGWL